MDPSPEVMESLFGKFDYHAPPNDTVVKAHERVRAACFSAAIAIVEICPDVHEQSLAITKLEEAMMWANAAIALNHEATTNRWKTGNDHR